MNGYGARADAAHARFAVVPPATTRCSTTFVRPWMQEVRREEAEAFAMEIGGIFFETSAKTALNVQAVFEAISRRLPAPQAPAFDSLADLKAGVVDPRGSKGGAKGGAGGKGGGCC